MFDLEARVNQATYSDLNVIDNVLVTPVSDTLTTADIDQVKDAVITVQDAAGNTASCVFQYMAKGTINQTL